MAQGRWSKKIDNGITTTVYVGTLFEGNVTTGVATTSYFAGSKRIAVRTGTGPYHLHGDHPSTSFDPVFAGRCGRVRMLGSGRCAAEGRARYRLKWIPATTTRE